MNTASSPTPPASPASQAPTPAYVLLADKQRVAPKLRVDEARAAIKVIYGFSDKPTYDLFSENSPTPCCPYPLVKGYLRTELNALPETLLLIAIDPPAPAGADLDAATYQSVLKAQETRSDTVAIDYRLKWDPDCQAYRVEKDTLDSDTNALAAAPLDAAPTSRPTTPE
ncbi:hypothetical protein FYK55_16085 [Roseiconus nitratireducens]|uniref:Uncharacterized protein n=1 Tax=Roseiconus nitratireducens TaxID=2605748 RepID=A0A5M6D2M2_9BACT|nr:hypothetical protein [Roseiconus nitratireducens]KAA5541744.1 hypothetical protein FYK55_16085 [Roseiconus nitratireducens]